MTQQLLDCSNVCAPLDKCRGEIVSEAVSVQVHASLLRPVPKLITKTAGLQPEDRFITTPALDEFGEARLELGM